MRLTNTCVKLSVFDRSGDKSEREVECLKADKVRLSFIQDVQMSKRELLGVHRIKLLEETVLKFNPNLRLFIAVPNSVMVSHVSIRPVSTNSKEIRKLTFRKASALSGRRYFSVSTRDACLADQ